MLSLLEPHLRGDIADVEAPTASGDPGRMDAHAVAVSLPTHSVFQSCHPVIPPLPFYEGCLFDACQSVDWEVVCSSLELYATLCAAKGQCIPWRSLTNNTCRECPAQATFLSSAVRI